MAAPPPAWFLGALDELARLGLPEVDEHRREDMWGGWEERWTTDQPAEQSTTLSRAIAMYPGCVWRCGSLQATPTSASFRGWFDQLAAISQGALAIGDVEEAWFGRSTVKARFAANGGWFELFPRRTYGSTLTRELLEAVTAAADRVVFHELVVDRGEGDEDEDDSGTTIVCLPRAAARKLWARGVRFVEWSPPAPPSRGRVTRWLEKLGLTRPLPVPIPPVTVIRRIGDRPAIAASKPPPMPAAPVAAPRHINDRPAIAASKPRDDGPLLSEIMAGAGSLRRVAEALQSHARPTWSPITEPGESPGHASKFGGAPWLNAGERPPRCASCDQPMALAVQLDLEALPLALRATGLLQCFVCLDDYEARAHVVGRARRAAAHVAAQLPARAILGWAEQRSELPGPAHWESLGVALCEPAAAAAEDELDDPAEGDKLGGWPAYIQQPSLGDCARCGQPRALLLQVASEGNLAVHFGDGGRLFVATCREHPKAVEARIEFH